MGLLTRRAIRPKTPKYVARKRRSRNDRRALYTPIHIHTETVCFLKWKRKVAAIGYNDAVQSRLYPQRPTPHPQFLAGAHNFPPHLSGVPPDPVPPLRLRMRRLGVHLPKLGGAGGSPRSFGREAAKPRSPSAPVARPLRSSPGGCGARLGARGRPAEPTPSHSRALGRAPCFGLPTNAGGVSAGRT